MVIWSYQLFKLQQILLKGELHPWPKISMFTLYLKIINTFLTNTIYILKQIVQGTQKWH